MKKERISSTGIVVLVPLIWPPSIFRPMTLLPTECTYDIRTALVTASRSLVASAPRRIGSLLIVVFFFYKNI
jgi:hypothetical protein